jgi:hypothetical protein
MPETAVLPDGTYIFKPKIPNLGKFWKVCLCWYFYGQFVFCMVIWYILWSFGLDIFNEMKYISSVKITTSSKFKLNKDRTKVFLDATQPR